MNYHYLSGAMGVNFVLRVRGYGENAINLKFNGLIYKSKNSMKPPKIEKKTKSLSINPVLLITYTVTNKDSSFYTFSH